MVKKTAKKTTAKKSDLPKHQRMSSGMLIGDNAQPKKSYSVCNGNSRLMVPFSSLEAAQACADENNAFLGDDAFRSEIWRVQVSPNVFHYGEGNHADSW